ncbi:MAG: LPS export ABC transporter permease LptG [Paracoccaceae bacterium]
MMGTLARYVGRRYLETFGAAFAAVFLLIFLVDLVEQLRRSAGGGAGFREVFALAALHAPSLMLEVLPFLALLAAVACFARLARSSELVVTRAAGVSVWRLITPAVIVAALIGTAAFSFLNPVASGLLARFETLEARYIRDRTSLLSVSENGLWLRQSGAGGQSVIHALRTNADGTRLWDVTVFRFDAGDRLTGRLAAGRAVLEPGRWVLHDVARWNFGEAGGAAEPGEAEPAPSAEPLDRLALPTELTREQILESFASPATISYWSLPGFIEALEAAGFSAARHRMHWQSQTALPALLAAMVLIGAAFSMRHARFGGLGVMALGALGSGLAYFFLANLTQAFGASGMISAPLAAWIPPTAMAMLAVGLLLHLEDG